VAHQQWATGDGCRIVREKFGTPLHLPRPLLQPQTLTRGAGWIFSLRLAALYALACAFFTCLVIPLLCCGTFVGSMWQ